MNWIDHERAKAGLPPQAPKIGHILIGVSGHFSAAHRDQETGEIHGHTWHVLAKFEPPNRVDSRCYKAALNALLALWDHKILPDELAWGEDIARAVGTLANCVEVEISRPAEGFYAWWRA